MAMIRHAYVAKEGFAGLMGVLMAQGAASAESKIILSLAVDSVSIQKSQRARLLKK